MRIRPVRNGSRLNPRKSAQVTAAGDCTGIDH
ncbi:hypothetical protein LTSEURB_4378, partial [Salmonella enterica subsp. enterica serovar Urbana str. R8-2977]